MGSDAREIPGQILPSDKSNARRQLQDIRQGPNETMYNYLEKFNHLERSCCTLGLPKKLIIEYLINGQTELDKKLLVASAGGSMMNLSLSGIRDLISKVVENARFREETTRQDEFFRTKNIAQAETSVNSMPEEMRQMKEMMMQFLRKQTVQVGPCEFCGSTDHRTDACPTLIEVNPVEANAVGGYPGYNNNNNNKAIPQPAQTFYQPPHKQYPTGQYQQKGPNQYQHQGPGVYQNRLSNNQPGSSQPSTSRLLEDHIKELAASQVRTNANLQQYQAEARG
ncbi:unnamed protein product [Rhodiola kirilowii]